MGRLILDISTIARWSGPPVGIVRVEHELAMHALRRRADIELSFYDPAAGAMRLLNPAWRETLLGMGAAIETTWLDVRRHRPAWRNALSPRYAAVMALERQRIAGAPAVARLAGAVQAVLLGRDGRIPPYADAAGRRIALVPYRDALGPVVAPGPGDTVLSAGSDWLHKGTALVELQRRLGFRLAVLCYDLLPLTHPEWFFENDVRIFGAYWRAVIPAAARILCNALCVAQDLRDFAAAEGLGTCDPRVVPLGYTPPALDRPLPPLPPGLEKGRFAVFVSTVEPRKGHATLLAAWKALLAQGVPQAQRFNLVIVGRRGWKVAALLEEMDALAADPAGHFLHLDNADDALLARVYRDAAFCLYPSRAEGFGLPVIEAMAHGKAVIASNGGAVAETAAGLAPCLDPLDVGAWTSTLGDWIADPAARAPWEARIARDFRYSSWPDAAERLFQAAVA
jgi:glycosyltransferase involved in cell wall biosynthesis